MMCVQEREEIDKREVRAKTECKHCLCSWGNRGKSETVRELCKGLESVLISVNLCDLVDSGRQIPARRSDPC